MIPAPFLWNSEKWKLSKAAQPPPSNILSLKGNADYARSQLANGNP